MRAAGAHQDRRDQPQLRGLDGTLQGDLIARVSDRGLDRRQLAGRFDEALVFHVLGAPAGWGSIIWHW